ncbi:MAG: class I SAM-dependent methyltransferase [Fimbriiglobus sp.]
MKPKLTTLVHEAVRARVRAGDKVVDATAGNGHDALFLYGLVCPPGELELGQVYIIDKQDEAIDSTKSKFMESGISRGIGLLCGCHAEWLKSLLDDNTRVRAVMFNLGYLPGGDKAIITRAFTTRKAIRHAWAILEPDGILSIIAYRGHVGGPEEYSAVVKTLAELPGAIVERHEGSYDETSPVAFLVTHSETTCDETA